MRTKRQEKIIELINKFNIETQDELRAKLEEYGYIATQATISRDIRSLGLYKAPSDNGNRKYCSRKKNPSFSPNSRLDRVFKESVVSVDHGQNILVIKTFTGMAMAVASAVDAMKDTEILGSIAGDDTVFCVLRNESIAIELENRFLSVLNEL